MCSFRSFIISCLLILTAVVIAYASEACFVTHSYDPSGWPSSGECSTWAGCTDSDADGRCQGYFQATAENRIYPLAILSCNDAQKVTYKHCAPHPDARCVNNGTQICLTFKVWSDTGCKGKSGTKTISSTDCITIF